MTNLEERQQIATILGVPMNELTDQRPVNSYLPDSLQLAELAAISAVDDRDLTGLGRRTIGEIAEAMTQADVRPRSQSTPDLVPPLATDRYQLIPVRREMTEALYRLSTDPAINYRWRFRGAFPTPETFEAALWQGVVAQFIVVATGTTDILGHVVCYGAEPAQQHAYVGAVFSPQLIATGRPIQPIALFINYLFTTWNFRKLYMEVPEFNMDTLWSGTGSFFRQEACFREHDYYGGRFWDKYVLAVYRDELAEVMPRLGLTASLDNSARLGHHFGTDLAGAGVDLSEEEIRQLTSLTPEDQRRRRG
jgi:hypothetical protein